LLSPLLDMARETGAVVVLIHHERKTKGKGGQEGRGIRGGSALFGLVDQALLLERRQGGNGNDRVLRSFGRYDDTPAEVLLTLDGSTFNRIGNPGDLEANRAKVWNALTDEGRDVPTLIAQTNLPEKTVRKALEGLGEQVTREGRGVKGDAYRYRRPAGGDSMPD